jgi:glycosyltransferase involved in cell wall biosynthesis
VFLGNFRHPPNVDALGLLAEVVDRLDPALLERHRVAVVGNALEPPMLGALATHPRVDAVGWVPAVEPYLEGARLSIVPLRHGAGTKRKLLQSLLLGTPCVSTPVGVEGLALEDGRNVLVGATPAALAVAVERLLVEDDTWERLSGNGRLAVEEAHGRERVRERLGAALEALLAP